MNEGKNDTPAEGELWSPSMMTCSQSDVGAIRHVLVKHAKDAFGSDQALGRQWRELGYPARPNFDRAVEEYEKFVAALLRRATCSELSIKVHYLPKDERTGLDSIYTRDASIVCDKGMILCNMGKAQRRPEPAAQEIAFREMGVPIHGSITGDGRIEGGDVVWIDRRTLAVGRGYRTNDEGIRQLRELLRDCVDELIIVPLPHWRGSADVFHLMSILSPIDHNLALVYSPLMPVPFRETLLARDIELVEVPEAEFETMGCNVLALAPRKCLMLSANPQTRARLERAGVEVHEFDGREISAKGCGGPTCLTRPIERNG